MPATDKTIVSNFDDQTVVRFRMVLGKLGRMLRQQNQVGNSELTYPQLALLFVIERRQPVTPGALAESEQVARPTITRFLNRLEELSLIRRTGGGTDGRARSIALTTSGKAVCNRERKSRTEWLTARLAKLSAEEERTLLKAIPSLERLLDEN